MYCAAERSAAVWGRRRTAKFAFSCASVGTEPAVSDVNVPLGPRSWLTGRWWPSRATAITATVTGIASPRASPALLKRNETRRGDRRAADDDSCQVTGATGS